MRLALWLLLVGFWAFLGLYSVSQEQERLSLRYELGKLELERARLAEERHLCAARLLSWQTPRQVQERVASLQLPLCPPEATELARRKELQRMACASPRTAANGPRLR